MERLGLILCGQIYSVVGHAEEDSAGLKRETERE